MVTE
jgi:hypothetical protein